MEKSGVEGHQYPRDGCCEKKICFGEVHWDCFVCNRSSCLLHTHATWRSVRLMAKSTSPSPSIPLARGSHSKKGLASHASDYNAANISLIRERTFILIFVLFSVSYKVMILHV